MGSRRKLPLDDDDAQVEAEELLRVNKAYARRLEYNKEREALHRLKELEKRGVVGSSDSSSSDDEMDDEDEDDDDGLLSEHTEAQFFETLAKIRNKDPSIYAEDTNFFDNSDEEADSRREEDIRKQQKSKPIYLKDALAHQLIDEGPDFDEVERKRKGIVTYTEEQQALKRDFLRSAEDPDNEDDDIGFLKLRKKQTLGVKEEGEINEQAPDILARLEDYFGKDEKLDENEKFLKEFLRKKSWIVQDQGSHLPSYDEIVGDDEEELEKQDRFEAEYNFRNEGDSGWQVMGHSRVVDDSVRRKDDSRRQKRLQKQQRLSVASFDRREELKQLKNIKKREILQKLEKIRTVAGAKATDSTLLPLFEGKDLEEDFDAEDYDRKMREAFGEEYYGAEDEDENFQGYEDMQKPDFDVVEDDLLGEPKSWNEEEEAHNFGFAAACEKVKDLHKADPFSGDNLDDFAENAEDGSPPVEQLSKRKKKGRISLREKLAFDKQLEEYYKLDYEDMIGGLPTRFKYHQVKPNAYGLTTSEILSADDKELNQFVSLKKLAPYAIEEWKPKGRFQGSQKSRKKRVLKQQVFKEVHSEAGYETFNGYVKSPLQPTGKEGTKQVAGGSEGTIKSKKKRRKKGLSLSKSRLIAYGKLSLPSKKRKRS